MVAFVTFILAAALVWFACFPLEKALRRRQLIDLPNDRSSHAVPTPRGGGIAIMSVVALGYVLAALLLQQPLAFVFVAAAVMLAVLSLRDDYRPLPASLRFIAHCAAAAALLGVLLTGLVSRATDWSFLMIAAAFIWIVGYTNAFNFMDGINGIAAGQSVVAGIGTALIGFHGSGDAQSIYVILPLILAGASLGFIPHNFPKARMFMGDVGSAPLGFLLASAVLAIIAAYGWSYALPLLLLHMNYILDTAITLARRIVRGERFYEAHNEHFYQRLVRAGKSHLHVTNLEMALQMVSLCAALLCLSMNLPGRIAAAVLVVGLWCGFFIHAETLFRRKQLALASGARAFPAAERVQP